MREEKKINFEREILRAVLCVLLVFAAVFTLNLFSVVSHAESQGKVSVSAKIREKPTTKSEVIDGAAAGESITVTGQIQGTDDTYIWYQVLTKDQKVGYIRSDLMSITSGGTPPTVNADGSVDTPTDTGEAGVYVAVNPASTTVTGTSPARVRAEASSSTTLLKTAETGLTLTVVGYQYDGEGNLWYKVKYSTNNEEVEGFVRSDYLAIQKEELVVADNTSPQEPEQPDAQPSVPVSTEIKDYDTMIGEDGSWILVDNTQSPAAGWEIKKLLEANDTNKSLYDEAVKKSKKKSTWITLLVIIIIALIAVVAIGFIKMRDMVEEADMLAAEKANTRRSADRPQGSRNVQPRSPSSQGSRSMPMNNKPQSAAKPASAQNSQLTKSVSMPKPDKSLQGTAGQQPKQPASQGQSQQVKKPRNIMDGNDDFEF